MVRRAPLDGKEPVRVEDMMKNAGRAVLKGTLSLILTASLVPSQAMVAMAEELNELAAQEQPVDEAEVKATEATVAESELLEADETSIAEEDTPTSEEDTPTSEEGAEDSANEPAQVQVGADGTDQPSDSQTDGADAAEIGSKTDQGAATAAPSQKAAEPTLTAQAEPNEVVYSFKDDEYPADEATYTYKDSRTLQIEAGTDINVEGSKLKVTYVDVEGKTHDADTGDTAALIIPASDLVWNDGNSEVQLKVEGKYLSFQLIDAENNPCGDKFELVEQGRGEHQFVIDTTSPKLVSESLPAANATAWTLTARDMSLDTQRSTVLLDGSPVRAGTTTSFDTPYEMNNLSEGEHVVEIQLVDKAGHETYVKTLEFEIKDNTKPTISVSWIGGSAKTVDEIDYYSSIPTAQIVIIEDNFAEELINIDTSGKVSQWQQIGNQHYTDVTFEDGTHTLVISGSDTTGNSFDDYEVKSFVVDTNAPEVVWNSTVDAGIYRSFEGSISDPNLDLDATEVFGISLSDLKKYSHAMGNDSYELVIDQKHKVGFNGSITIDWKTENGKYVFTAIRLFNFDFEGAFVNAADKAGNSKSTGEGRVTADSEAPEVYSAVISRAAVSTDAKDIDNKTNTVLFFNERKNGEATITLSVWDLTGVDESKVQLIDPNGTSAYRIESINSVRSSDHIGYDTTITISKLTSDAAFTNGFLISIPDKTTNGDTAAGNIRVWSLSETGKVTTYKEDGTPEEAEATNIGLTYGRNTQYGHPSKLIEDSTDPILKLSASAGEETVVEGQRYYASNGKVELEVTEASLPYLQFEDNNPGNREILTIVKKGSAPKKYTVADLNGTNKLSVDLSGSTYGDGDYTVTAELTDFAGNKGVATLDEFTIDTTAPEFTVDYGNEDSGHAKKTVDGITYFDAVRTATITVTEHNFDAKKMSVVVSHDGWVKSEPVVSEWDSDGDVHTCTVTFAEGGVYSLKVSGKDLAGNEALLNGKEGATEYGSGSFVIDVTPPTVNVDKGKPTDENKRDFDNVIKDQAEKAAFGGVAYFDAPQEITVTVKDRNLDLDNSVITVDGKAVGKGDWSKSTSDDDVVTYTYTYTYDETPDKSGSSEGMSYTPDVQLVDLAGNTKARASQPFVIDKKAPSIDSVKVGSSTTSVGSDKDSGDDPIQFYNTDTAMTFSMSDAHRIEKVELYDPENAYTGTSSIKRGEFDGSYTIELKDGTEQSDDAEYERDIYLQITDIAGNYRTWTIGRDGKIKNVTEDSIANTVTINDSGVYPYALIKDVMAPVTGLSGVTAGSYYNSAQTVHATVNEFNFGYLQRFDGSRAVLHITKYEGNAGRAMSTYDIPASSFTGSGSDWAYDEIFNSDGHYIVEASFDDYANNSSNVSRIEEFTIDMTAPIITIEFDNNDVRNGMYYNATRTATITVEEHNFDPNLINIQTTGSIGGWSSSGDTHTCTVFFDEAASHNLTVSGNDLAGNAANEVTEPEFVVDLTAPEITFGGVAQRLGFTGEEDEYNSTLQPDSAYNGVVAPSITFEDEQNFDTAGTEFTLVGNKVGDVSNTYDYGQSYGSNSETVQFDDFGLKGTDTAYDVNADDIYTINAHMTDLAGNEAEGAITFSVNRFGSNYIVAVEENGQQVDLEASSILDEAPTITVREINVSGAKSEADHSVMKEYANATSEIERQDSGNAEGYRLDTLDRRNTDHGWAEYVYTIRSANFGEGSSSDTGDGGQGIYRVNVASDDTASNVNTTADYWSSDTVRAQASAKVGTAEFTLDEVAPVIDETTLPDFIAPGREYQASFHVTDAITQGNSVEVYVDGERVAVSREGQEVAEGEHVGEGSFEFTIPARSFATRKVAIKVTDYAGRSAEAGDSGFFVTTLIPEIGVVAGVAAAIAGGVAYSKRKKDDGESIYDDGSLLK